MIEGCAGHERPFRRARQAGSQAGWRLASLVPWLASFRGLPVGFGLGATRPPPLVSHSTVQHMDRLEHRAGKAQSWDAGWGRVGLGSRARKEQK